MRGARAASSSPAEQHDADDRDHQDQGRDFERQQVRGEERLAEIGDAAEDVGVARLGPAAGGVRDRKRHDAATVYHERAERRRARTIARRDAATFGSRFGP